MCESKTVIFSYQLLSNVGCEIIIRGSIKFLTDVFPQYKLNFIVSSYHPDRDRKILADLSNVKVVPMVGWKRYLRGMLVKTGLDRRFWTPRFAARHFRNADLFVSVGGDIYTMSGNALPRDWLGWERFATRNGIPSIMFGANMEKFEVLSKGDLHDLVEHLKRFRLIVVRDVATLEYLSEYGVKGNTVFFPDPLFSLRPSCTFSNSLVKTIGLNMSPILLRDFGSDVFVHIAKIVVGLVGLGYRFSLIPHVYASDGNPTLQDPVALRRLYDLLPKDVLPSVRLYEGPMSFAEMTREINAVDLFIGARMHSCLNALTLGKPTYFLAYSKKAQTMVSWLREGPLATLSDRVQCGAANEVSLDAIVSLIRAHEQDIRKTPLDIDFGADREKISIGKLLNQAALFER